MCVPASASLKCRIGLTCVYLSVRAHSGIQWRAGLYGCRHEESETLSVCLDLHLCGWAPLDMSQATSRPHKSVSLGGGILMWKWEQ